MNKLREKIQAKNKTALIFFPAFDWEISPTHPERKERLLYTRDQVFEEGLLDIEGIIEYNPDIAEYKDIQRTHICIPSVEKIAAEPHLISAGGAVKAGRLVLEEKTEKAFAIVRPPGHHAHRVVHGPRGFCTINNEAVMVETLRQEYPDLKIAFVDTDAHHADGTQEIFYHDPDVLHISLHQDGRTLFPGSGFIDELGGPQAYAGTLNIPLPPGTKDEGLLYTVREFVLPVLSDFKPDLVINAAGQDNHYSDPLTNMGVSARGYAEMNSLLNPDLAILQGGYSIESALPYVNVGLILAMAGLDYSCVQEPDYNSRNVKQDKRITENIKKIISKLQSIWENRNEFSFDNACKRLGYKKEGNFYSRKKNIFYDTAGINEEQLESLRKCEICPGYLIIKSTAGKSSFNQKAIAAVSIPQKACERCSREAREKYNKLKNDAEYDYIYLQDKKEDEYLQEKVN